MLADFICCCVLLSAALAEELVLFVVPYCIFPVLVFCPKAKIDGDSNSTVIKRNKKDPADAENKTRCFG